MHQSTAVDIPLFVKCFVTWLKTAKLINENWRQPEPVGIYCDRGSPIEDEVDAKVMFDAAHQFGIILGKAGPSPLTEGAHFMTLSTYKTLGGPAGGLIVSNDQEIAKKLDTILFPAMNANLDATKSAAFATAMLDWRYYGQAYVA